MNSSPRTAAPLHVMVVDDSAVTRQTLSAILSQVGAMTVDTASDPLIAHDKLRRRRPDVLVLDLEMPRMDGLTFLRRLMRDDPLPVVVCSGLVGSGSQAALRALEEGAVEVIAKPRLAVREFLEESAITIVDAVRAAALSRRRTAPCAWTPGAGCRPVPPAHAAVRRRHAAEPAPVAMGASTGGTEALLEILEALPVDAPGLVVVQHMPEFFTRAFAERLNALCRIEVKEASDGDLLRAGRALIAPGNRHLELAHAGADYLVRVSDGPLVSRHRPSVDVLFRSVARSAGSGATGVILTGMGQDGAEGLLAMKQAGARTLAQDEASCVVFGMPQAAIARGAVAEVVPLRRMAAAILDAPS